MTSTPGKSTWASSPRLAQRPNSLCSAVLAPRNPPYAIYCTAVSFLIVNSVAHSLADPCTGVPNLKHAVCSSSFRPVLGWPPRQTR